MAPDDRPPPSFPTEEAADAEVRRRNLELGARGRTDDYYSAVEGSDGEWHVVRRTAARGSLWDAIVDFFSSSPWL